MEAKCNLKYQRFSDRKIAQVLSVIKGKSLLESEYLLKSMPKRSAEIVYKAVRSAGANLSVKLGKRLDLNEVWIKSAYSGKGSMKYLRRFNAGPMGRAMPFKRNMCHLMVIVTDSKEAK